MVYSQRYPLFWKGNNHTNVNSNVLFECIQIEKDTPEYIFVQRSFNKTVSEAKCQIAIVRNYLSMNINENFHLDRTCSKSSSMGKI